MILLLHCADLRCLKFWQNDRNVLFNALREVPIVNFEPHDAAGNIYLSAISILTQLLNEEHPIFETLIVHNGWFINRIMSIAMSWISKSRIDETWLKHIEHVLNSFTNWSRNAKKKD